MAEAHKTTVIGIECLGEAEPGQSGVISCETIPYDELDDETLSMLFEQSPEWVMEKRPDWVKKNHPNKVN